MGSVVNDGYRYAASGDWDRLRELLEAGLPPDSVAQQGLLLEGAVYGEQLATLRLLVAYGADIRDTNRWLLTAARAGCVGAMEMMLELGADVHTRDERGRSSLMRASIHGNMEAVEYLVERYPATITDVDLEGMNALHRAASGDYVDCVRYLSDRIPVNAVNQSGETPLHVACSMWSPKKRFDVVAVLLDAGAHIEARDATGRTPLLAACLSGNAAIVEGLVRRGANQKACDNAENDALHCSVASCSSPGLVEYFVRVGLRPDVRNQHGLTAAEMAAANGQLEVVRLLAKR